MAVTDPEIIGIIVSAAVAGLVLLVVFIILAVYCYRAIDESGHKRSLRKKRQLIYAEPGHLVHEPMYYGDSASSAGTTARLVPAYHLPVIYGGPMPYPASDYTSLPTTLEKSKKKAKRNDVPNDVNRSSKYSEHEGHLDFGEENRDSRPGSVAGDQPVTVDEARVEPDDQEPVIVTYLEDPKNGSEETQTKTNAVESNVPNPPPAPLPGANTNTQDPDNGEKTPSDESHSESDEAYRHRQREPPKGDVEPPEDYDVTNGEAVLY